MARQIENPSIAVERTLLILEAAGQRESGLSNADFSRKLKIPKSSASYILRTLEQHGYLRRDHEDGKYRLGYEGAKPVARRPERGGRARRGFTCYEAPG